MTNTPSRENRLRKARTWIKEYPGKNLVKGYAKQYGVDKLCAIKELRMIGVEISEAVETNVRQSLEALRKGRLTAKLKREKKEEKFRVFDSDENFAFIVGYTSGGFPYGLTHEEFEEMNRKDSEATKNTGNEDEECFHGLF